MRLKEDYPITEICLVLDLPRSSAYYQSQKMADMGLRQAIQRLAGDYPTYGYRRITAMLKREGWAVNHKRILRIMNEMGLTATQKRRKKRTTSSNHSYPRYPNLVKELAVVRPDQVWVSDITYIQLRYETVYLAVIMDVYTRAIRGWHLGRSLEQELTLTALRQALETHTPEIHHSDQGVQYAATQYTDLLQQHGAQISMAATGKPEENGFAERLIRTIKEEEVELSEYSHYHDAYHRIGQFLEDVYTRKRIHSSLGYLTPAEFEAGWVSQQLKADDVH
jgi:transposase InsO family protein